MKWKIALGCIAICIGNGFSQQQSCEKHVFVYKTVNGHEINANVFEGIDGIISVGVVDNRDSESLFFGNLDGFGDGINVVRW